nr:L1 [Kappapapillomavirus 2]
MAVWLSTQNKFYLPPQPVTKIPSTDEYVTRTNVFYYASSDRLLTVGHPYYEIRDKSTMLVPKVSPNQYRVFRIKLPDPNKFAFGDKQLYDPEKERLVWCLRGIEVNRGQPLGVSVTGNPIFNKFDDVENPTKYYNNHADQQDYRKSMAFDPKQVQLLMLGCVPATGEHWAQAKQCAEDPPQQTDCPPIELVNTVIEDGDMCEIGFGAMDHKTLQASLSEVPLELAQSISKYPDYLKMQKDQFGDSMFFYARREQMYARHFFSRAGGDKENVKSRAYIKRTQMQGEANANIATDNYCITPSGSLVSSDSQVFNRAYWLQKAQGMNNGVCWDNQIFVTVVDNTRGTILSLVTKSKDAKQEDPWKNSSFSSYLRHVEEYELQFVLQLCKVKLTPENLSYLHSMHPTIIDNWQLSVSAQPSGTLEDQYRYLQSIATKCPPPEPPKENTDPYKNYKFWEVDLSEKLSDQLDQYPLGRKFLNQSGLQRIGTKRPAPAPVSTVKSSKRKRRT